VWGIKNAPGVNLGRKFHGDFSTDADDRCLTVGRIGDIRVKANPLKNVRQPLSIGVRNFRRQFRVDREPDGAFFRGLNWGARLVAVSPDQHVDIRCLLMPERNNSTAGDLVGIEADDFLDEMLGRGQRGYHFAVDEHAGDMQCVQFGLWLITKKQPMVASNDEDANAKSHRPHLLSLLGSDAGQSLPAQGQPVKFSASRLDWASAAWYAKSTNLQPRALRPTV